MIKFSNVKFNNNGIVVIDDVNFTIKDLSTTCIVGSKGSGKTSILKLIAGIYTNYYGEIFIDDKYIEHSQKKVSIFLDTRETNKNMTVYEYLKFYGYLYDINENELNLYIDKMLNKFSIMIFKHTDIDILDLRVYKIVELIRIMITDPQIILLDNVFIDNNDDYNNMVIDFIKEYCGKKTIIFANRNLNYINEICDYLCVIVNGKIIAYGDKKEVLNKAKLSSKIGFRVCDDVENALAVLKNISYVHSISYDDKKIVFMVDGDENVEYSVLKALIDEGIKVYSYEREYVSVERIYNKLLEEKNG